MQLRLIAATAFILVPLLAQAQTVPERWKSAWPQTDFSQLAVEPSEILSGGPPKDGIPAITGPEMVPAADEADRFGAREPMMVLAVDGTAPRAYPLRYLMWHEVVNDEAGGVPFAVTFCPLCNSGLIFDRRLDGQLLEFGVSGLLRLSNLILYDRQTESWWQQFDGRAIAGELTGAKLTPLPAWMESWESFRNNNPDGLVMAEPQGYRRDYGTNPYVGYDTGRPFLYRGENPPDGINPVERVVRIGNRAWPMTRLSDQGEIVEAGYRLTWKAGQASALDSARISEGREVGDIRVYDAATGENVIHEIVFAFAFQGFEPDGIWMTGE